MCDGMTRWPNRQASLRSRPKHQEAEYAGCRTSGRTGVSLSYISSVEWHHPSPDLSLPAELGDVP